MSLLDIVKKINPSFSHIEEQPIITPDGNTVGLHSAVVTNNNLIYSGGTHSNPTIARRIAIAEFIERSLVDTLFYSDEKERFLLNEFPTASGFAAGFDESSTRFRSLCEGVERYAWSKWIDFKHPITELQKEEILLTPLASYLAGFFTSFRLFQQMITICHPNDGAEIDLMFSVFLGETTKGIFAGSRVTSSHDDMWTHAVVEAYRNFHNFNIWKKKGISIDPNLDYVTNRVLFFGENKNIAISQIPKACLNKWSQPEIILHEGFSTSYENIFLFRTILKDWMSWHLGNKERFVY